MADGKHFAALREPGPTCWVVEYGAVALPIGNPSRITTLERYETPEAAAAAAEAADFNSRTFAAYEMPGAPMLNGLTASETAETASVAGLTEPTRSRKLAAAGFTPRDNRLPCDECGERLSPLGLQVHKCAEGEVQAEPSAEPEKFQWCGVVHDEAEEPSGDIDEEQWLRSAERVFLAAGDDEAFAKAQARYLLSEEDQSDVRDPYEVALEDIEGRPAQDAGLSDEERDAAHLQTLEERDSYHEWADKLAGAIAEYFGVDIGEHSNLNNPWEEALNAVPVTGATHG